jgi:hypothetical protein
VRRRERRYSAGELGLSVGVAPSRMYDTCAELGAERLAVKDFMTEIRGTLLLLLYFPSQRTSISIN